MKKYSITPEHQIELDKIKHKYIANSRRTDPMTGHDKSQMLVAMRGLYANARIPYCGDHNVVFVRSPLEAQCVSAIAMSILNSARMTDTAVDTAEMAARTAAYAAARTAARTAADTAEMAARTAARAAYWNNAKNSLDIYVNHYVGIAREHGSFALYSLGNAWRYCTRSAMWPYYQVFGEFFKDVAKIKGDWYKWVPLSLDALHGGVRYMTPEFTIISDRPEVLTLDEAGRLHNDTTCAVRWRDGMEQFYWHGVSIPDNWILHKDNLTAAEVLKSDNTEQRAAGCEIVGWAKMEAELGAKIINDSGSKDIGYLIEMTLPGLAEPERFLKAWCPRNGWIYEGVPKVSDVDDLPIETALHAQAWRVGDAQSEYVHPIART